MSSDDLEAIRARRMQEMQQQRAQQGGKVISDKIPYSFNDRIRKIMKIQSGGQGDQQAAEEERKAQVDDMKNSILSQVLSQEARARCEYSVS